jgi:protein TonB
MKSSLLFAVSFSISLHVLLAAAFSLLRPGARKFEGYPTVVPVELVSVKPTSYKAPEVQKIQPKIRQVQPKPKELESVIIEKRKLPEEEEPAPKPQVKPEPKEEEPKEGKSVVGGKSVRLDVDEFPFSYYLALLQSRIQTNWEPPFRSVTVSRKALVYFKIQRNGQITSIVLESSSGDRLFDQAAIRAVTLANPLPQLPYDFPERQLGVHFEFEQGL